MITFAFGFTSLMFRYALSTLRVLLVHPSRCSQSRREHVLLVPDESSDRRLPFCAAPASEQTAPRHCSDRCTPRSRPRGGSTGRPFSGVMRPTEGCDDDAGHRHAPSLLVGSAHRVKYSSVQELGRPSGSATWKDHPVPASAGLVRHAGSIMPWTMPKRRRQWRRPARCDISVRDSAAPIGAVGNGSEEHESSNHREQRYVGRIPSEPHKSDAHPAARPRDRHCALYGLLTAQLPYSTTILQTPLMLARFRHLIISITSHHSRLVTRRPPHGRSARS